MGATNQARVRYGRIAGRAMLCFVAIAAVAVGLRATDRAARAVGEARSSVQGELLQLTELMAVQASTHVAVERVLVEPDVAQRIPDLEVLLSQREAAKALWAELRPALPVGPTVQLAIDRYEEAGARAEELTDFGQQVVLAPDPSTLASDPRFAELRQAQDDQRAALRDLFALTGRQAVVDPADDALGTLRSVAPVGDVWLGLAAVGVIGIALLASRLVQLDVRAAREAEAERSAEARQVGFDQSVGAALAMARSEEATLRVTEEALHAIGVERSAELLLADSSRAHLEPVVVVSAGGDGAQCPVRTPGDCPAVNRGQSITFRSSEELAACPYLKLRPSGACSAVCVPMSISSRSVGVLHMVGPVDEPPDGERTRMLVSLVARVGDHLTQVRTTSATAAQAATDALTGLSNRRTFENEFRRIAHGDGAFAIAFGDVDRFKQLNDDHGHDTGDRALRILARVMRRSLREGDLLARWGGEEFVLLFKDLNSAQAAQTLERLRTNLAIEQTGGSIPPFTISFGVCDDTHGRQLGELLGCADAALLAAKEAGRNRVVVADGSLGSPREDAVPS